MSAAPLSVEALAPLLPAKARLIGVDLGTKTVGLALSDVERRIATPLTTLKRIKFGRDAESLAAQISQFEAVALVFGMPLGLDGKDTPRAQATRAFAREYQRLRQDGGGLYFAGRARSAVSLDALQFWITQNSARSDPQRCIC
jgi:putative Holliday junction resolvase